MRITDHGCMFRGYARAVVDAVNQCTEYNTFVPALAYTFAMRPVEIRVAHEDRGAGESKYSLFRLMRLNFDLMTGFSSAPMQLFSAFGIVIALLSVLFVAYLAVRRLVVGPEAEGVFTLFAIAFFLIGVALFGVGLLGEYVGRIYDEVRHRPRYIVGAVLERAAEPPPGARLEQRHGRRAPWSSPTTTSACAACACCSRTAGRGRLVVTHLDAPGEPIWFEASRSMPPGTTYR